MQSSPLTMVKKLTRVAAVRCASQPCSAARRAADGRQRLLDRVAAFAALPERIEERREARLLAVAAELIGEALAPSARRMAARVTLASPRLNGRRRRPPSAQHDEARFSGGRSLVGGQIREPRGPRQALPASPRRTSP